MKQSNVEKLGPFNYKVAGFNYRKKAEEGHPKSQDFRGYNTARKRAHSLMNDLGCSEVTITITRN